MIIAIPIKDGKRLEFKSIAEVGQHYALLANAYRRKGNTERADAYDIVSWQLQNAHVYE